MAPPDDDTAAGDVSRETSAARVARDAALQSLVSNAVYLAIVLGVTVGIARRDFLARQLMRAKRVLRQEGRAEREDAAVADLARQVSVFEHCTDPRKWSP